MEWETKTAYQVINDIDNIKIKLYEWSKKPDIFVKCNISIEIE